MNCDNPIYFNLTAKRMYDVSFVNTNQRDSVSCNVCSRCEEVKKKTSDRVRKFRLRQKECV